jgi:uncharacterized protein
MSRIAVIGSGIAGLASAYLLSREHEVTVLERDERVGGHTHTANANGVAVDTGFIVHNRVNYPNFIRLMDELGIETCESDMSFAASGNEYPWCSRGLNGLLAHRRNALRAGFWGLWLEVLRFNRQAPEFLVSGDVELSMGEYLRRRGHSKSFKENYLYPMAGAVWSTTIQEMEAFPAATLIRFFQNHGFLGVSTHHPWRTIPGGTSRYLEPLSRSFRERIRTQVNIQSVTRQAEQVLIQIEGSGSERFDHVVFACHGDQVLPMLRDASELEREVFSAFSSNKSPTVLHQDLQLMPKARRAWASWNYHQHRESNRLVLSYHMNRLQPLSTPDDFFVSLHAEDLIDPSKVLSRYDYEHPRYTREAIRSQARWQEVSGVSRTHFAGAYWSYGFHEDGLNSAIRVAKSLGIEW